VDDAISSLQRTLDWAGLDYDEGGLGAPAHYGFLSDVLSGFKGPGRGGDVGPYIQVNTLSAINRRDSRELKLKLDIVLQSERRDIYNQHIKTLLDVCNSTSFFLCRSTGSRSTSVISSPERQGIPLLLLARRALRDPKVSAGEKGDGEL
jgi:hypothetical protein